MALLPIAGAITALIVIAPLVHDLNQKQPLGTAYANIGKGFGKGLSDLASPKIKPEFIPKIGFQLDIPDWLVPK
jgi:hypothetical protein